MNTYFTADFHAYHSNIIRYCNRPQLKKGDLDKKGNWISEYIKEQRGKEMNEFLIKRWNDRVKEGDLVFHIGDFGFGKKAFDVRKRLNGDIIFLQGNHDRNNNIKTRISRIVIRIGKDYINLVHNPQFADSKFRINLIGHVHGAWECKRVRTHFGFTDCINVGVDVWNYYPVTYNELMKRYYKWRKGHDSKKRG